MSKEIKTPNRFSDAPRDKPQGERVEHANIERPGAQSHPRFGAWERPDPAMAWRLAMR